MIHTQYRITCDVCGRREHNGGDDTLEDVVANAASAGWSRRVVPNGATWDVCPRCLEIELIELIEREAEAKP